MAALVGSADMIVDGVSPSDFLDDGVLDGGVSLSGRVVD